MPDIFRFFVTTKRLLQFASKAQSLLHTDATYSVNWNGFPLLIIGTSDLNRTFHPLGCALCSKEAHFDYKFLFSCLALGRTQVGEEPLGKLNLMADAAAAITNGINESLIECLIRAMCWFHVKNCTDKKIKMIKDETKRAAIISDIVLMQLCQTPAIFEAATKLFLKEWANDQDNDVVVFIAYFKKEWLDINYNWFEGHPQIMETNL